MSLVPYSGMESVPPALEDEGNPYTPGKFLQSAFMFIFSWFHEVRRVGICPTFLKEKLKPHRLCPDLMCYDEYFARH